eukprot:CAMPEP_0177288764 /NCGR_PEP_ID=MMETSP0367-20130122/74842_1 /TAXON_ID=447022 ORGANISM="Scrippsiella hangoei-like, Strain SHHI-4" /NCGR_SAMPLE_ID=MMETSP0367 /ASSEMBLY_ACC=CAM_ASM_000362 /LENGTH=56 /DNA_ID=CAMNT_0018746123 /DNA_START=17 /DNA_END=184 /DNA_ORIENTATION=-
MAWPYWYHPESQTYAFDEPPSAPSIGEEAKFEPIEPAPSFSRCGPVWDMTCDELKE